MAAIPVTIDGVLYDLHNRTTQRVILFGDASLQGVGVGGGPIQPPGGGGQPPGGGGQPPGIWGPTDPRPQPPIANVPGVPPSIDGPPTDPPQPPTDNKPPPDNGGWGWVAEWSQWGYFPGQIGAQPKHA